LSIHIEEFSPGETEAWDRFVDKSNNGTIFHKLRFLDYHPENRFNFNHLIFHKDGKILALLPGGMENRTFKSPRGASFGGFVLKDTSFSKTDKIVKRFLEYCIHKDIERVSLIPAPIIYSKVFNMNLDYALLSNGFKYSKHFFTSAIDLHNKDIESLQIYKGGARNAIRKADKSNIRVEIKDDYDSFYPILSKNKEKFKTPPTHSLTELKKLTHLIPENLKLFLAYRKGKLIAGSLIFICNSKTLLAFYIALDYNYQKFRPINYLLHEIVKWGRTNAFNYLDLGVNQEPNPDNPMELNPGLVSFKESMGAKCFFRSEFCRKV